MYTMEMEMMSAAMTLTSSAGTSANSISNNKILYFVPTLLQGECSNKAIQNVIKDRKRMVDEIMDQVTEVWKCEEAKAMEMVEELISTRIGEGKKKETGSKTFSDDYKTEDDRLRFSDVDYGDFEEELRGDDEELKE